jgi:hypothetical protein
MREILCLPVFLFAIATYSFAQNIGIGTSTPAEKLHVAGNIKSDTIKPSAIKLTPNAGAGKMLTSDAVGNASWQERSAGEGVGFGLWGDCASNGNITDYHPVADTAAAEGDHFGACVSISGNYAIVGTYLDDVGANLDQGSASIYQYNGSRWVLMQKLTDPTGAGNDYFGSSVFISGNYAIVGAFGDDASSIIDQGSASIYQYNGSSWVLMQKLTDVTGAASDGFGNSVSISGNYAIVGAALDDVSAIDQGSTSIYRYNGSNWVLMQKLTDPAGAGNDNFGISVSISGNYIIVGAYLDNVNANTDQGSASIYQYNGSTWVLMQQLTDATGAATDYFGISVSISGNYAIVGAYSDDVGANTFQGSASIYQYNGSSWVLMLKLTDANGASGDLFGICVSISGSYAIVGAYGDNAGSENDEGSASIYLRVGQGWQKLQYVSDPANSNTSENFGAATAIDGSTQRFLIGAFGYANSSGKVVFGKVN